LHSGTDLSSSEEHTGRAFPVFYNALRFSFALLLLIPIRKKLGIRLSEEASLRD
jgi:hypothetical protein